MTVVESLRAITNYPIPERTLERAALYRGLDPALVIDSRTMDSQQFKLAEADIYEFLSTAPNVSEGGVSFSLSEQQRQGYKHKADDIRTVLNVAGMPKFGYKGEML
jgi:hypothetical protein